MSGEKKEPAELLLKSRTQYLQRTGLGIDSLCLVGSLNAVTNGLQHVRPMLKFIPVRLPEEAMRIRIPAASLVLLWRHESEIHRSESRHDPGAQQLKSARERLKEREDLMNARRELRANKRMNCE